MDPFVNAYKDVVLGNYANFEGRTDRGTFWRFVLVNVIISIVLSILAQTLGVLFWIIYVLYALALIVPGIAAGARRFHDLGKSGWMMLIGLIPFVGWIILIVLLVPEGDPGPNEYGPVPIPAT